MATRANVFIASRAAVASACLLGASCASLTYVDDEGVTHVAGLVNMTIAPALVHGSSATGKTVTISGVGVSILDAGGAGGVTFGYFVDHVTVLDGNSWYGTLPEDPAASESQEQSEEEAASSEEMK